MRSRKTLASSSSNSWVLEGLEAQGPVEELKEKLMLFGQLVGDWDILEDRYLRPDGGWTTGTGELHWRWILGGRAVQDVWMAIDENGKAIPEGTTVRFYNREIDAWNSVWLSPAQGAVKIFIGRKSGDEIVLEGKTVDGFPVKWIFSEITPNSFRWHSEECRDGKTWFLREEMRIRRKP